MSHPSSNPRALGAHVNVLSVAEIAPDVLHLRVKAPSSSKLTFAAGQFALIRKDNDPKGISRAYSVATAPYELPHLEFCIRLYPNGNLSEYLRTLKKGDEMFLHLPYGRFTIPDESTKKRYVFVVTGTGIAPVRSMIRQLLHEETSKQLVLIHGTRKAGNLYFANEFKTDAQAEKLTYVQTLSDPDPNWQGQTGYVTELLESYFDADTRFFLCGNPAMVKDVTTLLTSNNISSISVEKW